MPVVALVGYTNAGKTTLLNRMSGEIATAKDQLFTTLDPLARRVRLPNGETIVLTDTVGFLHHLPHHLIEAFKATLEETRGADLLLHMVDVSHPLVLEHLTAVEDVLKQLDLKDKPTITVFNKCDREERAMPVRASEPAATISAKTGQGVDRLLALIQEELAKLRLPPTRLRLPGERADLVAALYRSGQVLKRREMDGTIELLARIPPKLKPALAPYVCS